MISPSDMLLFAAVVREGSFTAAARQLGITKQTASERIAKLEGRLGVRLLERNTRHIRLTDVGCTYHDRCSSIATQIEEANNEVQHCQSEPVGLLRVSAPVLYGRRFLMPVITDFLRRYSKVRVEVVLADRRVHLLEEGIDLTIRIGPLEDSSLAARKLGEGWMYYVASPAFLSTHGIPHAKSLATVRCVGMSSSEMWEIGGVKSKIEPILVVNDLEMACDAATAGLGLARLPSLVCRDAVLDGRLRILFGSEPTSRRPVYALYPSRQYLPAKVRIFLDSLETLVAPMSPIDVFAK
ncbi:MAG: LysR family transcriptional regulator [Myxococcales bacterium]|jgi:DNA-binding transcriptional LysR family regulator|nr:LysR family transcriptional regulator [Myxococcales bacterium]